MNPLRDIRFLDLSPDAMRRPSMPGQPLGDRGENLASVLHAMEWFEDTVAFTAGGCSTGFLPVCVGEVG